MRVCFLAAWLENHIQAIDTKLQWELQVPPAPHPPLSNADWLGGSRGTIFLSQCVINGWKEGLDWQRVEILCYSLCLRVKLKFNTSAKIENAKATDYLGRKPEMSMGGRVRIQPKSAPRCTLSPPHILDCCWHSRIHNRWNLSFKIQQEKETCLDSDLQQTELVQSFFFFFLNTIMWYVYLQRGNYCVGTA